MSETSNQEHKQPFVKITNAVAMKTKQRRWELQQSPMKTFSRPPYAYTSEEVISDGFDRERFV